MADWKDVLGAVAPYAPTIGKVVGGLIPFPGGAMVGEFVGGLLARQFGVAPTPEAVGTAINESWHRDENATRNALSAVDAEVDSKWDALARMAEAEARDRTAQSQAINETMRVEVAQGVSPWHWRHLIGYATLIWAIALLPPVVYHMWRADAEALQAVTAAITASTLIFGILAGLNGYIANDSTRLREAAITGNSRENVVVTTAKKLVGR